MAARTSPLIAIFGPTAVGKTDVAVALSDALAEGGVRCTAVSTDAYQLYRGLGLLSGAPGDEIQERLPHRFVGSHDPREQMSAGRFAREAQEAIAELQLAGVLPILVGGAGLYMQATLTELEMRQPLTEAQERRFAQENAGTTTGELYRRLKDADPKAASAIDPADRYRLERALALSEAGEPAAPGSGFWQAPLRQPTLLFGLIRDREELYSRIDSRVEAMIAAGARQEIARARDASSTARKVIGFRELPSGEVEEMKRRTRRYAKRQLTWMRRIPGLETIDLSSAGTEGAAQLIARSWSGSTA